MLLYQSLKCEVGGVRLLLDICVIVLRFVLFVLLCLSVRDQIGNVVGSR